MEDLSVKKQDKALIHAKRARNIRTVLIDPKDTAVESAQFRYVAMGNRYDTWLLFSFLLSFCCLAGVMAAGYTHI